jgi:signal transduction histidine kinase
MLSHDDNNLKPWPSAERWLSRIICDFGYRQFTAEYGCHHILLEDGILIARGKGFMSKEAADLVLHHRQSLLTEAGLWEKPHLELMTQVEPWIAPSAGAQRRFSRFLIEESRRGCLRGYYGISVPPSTRWLLKIGVHVYRLSVPIQFFNSFDEALETLRQREHGSFASVAPAASPPRWKLEIGDYCERFWLLDQRILYSDSRGTLRKEHIGPLFELLRQIINEAEFDKSLGYSRAIETRDFVRSTWEAKRIFLRELRELHRLAPCHHIVFLSANKHLQAISRASAALVPNKTLFASSLHEARGLIETDRAKRLAPVSSKTSFRWPTWLPFIRRATVDREMNAFLAYIDHLDWEQRGTPNSQDHAKSPILPAFDAVNVFKNDFDFVLTEREELRRQLTQSAKMASLGTLTAGLAHELKNPLSIVLGYSEALKTKNPELEAKLEKVIRAAQRMQTIIDHFRTFARSGENATSTPVDLSQALNNSLIGLETRARALQIALDITPSEKPLSLQGDATEIETILRNLIGNALDALETHVTTTPKKVSIHWEASPEHTAIHISDNGPGIPEHIRDRVFDPFFTTKEVGKGTGLGLAMVQGIVSRMKGTIQLQSPPDGGTTIILSFPLSR